MTGRSTYARKRTLAALVRDVGFRLVRTPSLRAGGRGDLRPAAQNALVVGEADRDEAPAQADEDRARSSPSSPDMSMRKAFQIAMVMLPR